MSNNNRFTVENGRVDSQPSPTSTSKSNSSCQCGQVLGFAVLNLNRGGLGSCDPAPEQNTLFLELVHKP